MHGLGSGKTIILVLHDILLALKVSHRIVAMQDGKTIACKAPEDMIASDIFRKLYGAAYRLKVQTVVFPKVPKSPFASWLLRQSKNPSLYIFSAAVSFAGLLGFIGLIVPHFVRRLAGNESGKLLPFKHSNIRIQYRYGFANSI